jgi:transglutaminase-like putative cysteine protease
MLINYGCEIAISVTEATPVICLLDVHPQYRARIVSESPFRAEPRIPVLAHYDSFGNYCHRLTTPAGELRLCLDGIFRANGFPDPIVQEAREIPVERLPDETIAFLAGSRYCETDRMSQVAWDYFGAHAPGWARAQAVCDFVHNHLTFDYQHARATRTALDAFDERIGVCRDFAHLMIALCRCLNIPARYVNGYLGDIGVPADPAPMDFSAWVEVYLEGGWYTFDPRHNQRRIGRIVVARGRDATDVPLINSFGPHTLKTFRVWTQEVAAPQMQAC